MKASASLAARAIDACRDRVLRGLVSR